MRKENKGKALIVGLRHFVVAFLIFTVLFTGIGFVFSKIGDINLFSGIDEGAVSDFTLASIVDTSSPFFHTFSESEKVNILLLGVNPPLSDTIMLASFDMKTKHIDLISIPRDTYYPRDGYNHAAEKKLNAAYRKDPLNTAVAVSEILQGIPIHYYAVIEFEGIENIVDSMNGVPVNVPFAMRYNDPADNPPLHISIEKGEQVLMGKDAVDYLRFRKSNVKGFRSYATSDLEREKAQQEFLKSAFQQSITHLPSVVKSIHENVVSNIDLKTALQIASKTAGMSKDDIATYSLPGTAMDKSPWYYHPDEEAIKTMLTHIYMPPVATDAGISTNGSIDK